MSGGVNAVQLREKDLGGKELFELAEKTRRLCDRYHAALFINDRIDVARAIDAAGVQLGKNSLPIQAARSLLGPDRWIGASIHSRDEAIAAGAAGADFVVFGPVFYTPSKAKFGAPQGLAALKEVVQSSPVPVYAIGGITTENMTQVLELGAAGIALIAAIIAADDPQKAAGQMARLLGR